jgi:uncharacterized protein
MDIGGGWETRARAMVGQEFGPVFGPEPVNRAMVRHWCEALGFPHQPVTGAGSDTVVGILSVPLSMMQVWTMMGNRGVAALPGSADDAWKIHRLFADEGYSSIVGTSSDQRYTRELREGEHIAYMSHVSAISPLKKTGLGFGYFITVRYTFLAEGSDPVGTMDFCMLAYRKEQSGQEAQ